MTQGGNLSSKYKSHGKILCFVKYTSVLLHTITSMALKMLAKLFQNEKMKYCNDVNIQTL